MAALVACLACVGAPAGASAAGQDELQVSLRIGTGMVNVDGREPWGIATALDAAYGLSDAWALRLSLEGSLHSVSANAQSSLPGGAIRTDAIMAGAVYALDILRLVPYAELELGVAQIAGAVREPQTMLATELGVGADYFATRQLLAGVSFQYLLRPQDLLSNPLNLGNSPFEFSATARLSWIF